jgi:hypothetical protein
VQDETRYYGIYRGIVKDISDKQKQRRIKVTVPQLTGDAVLNWAWPLEASNIHTEVPVIGQGVWISFIGGDPEYPVWFGAFGTHKGKSKVYHVKPLANSVSLSGLSPYLITVSRPDGTVEIDLTETLVAMAQTLKNHEQRIQALEAHSH